MAETKSETPEVDLQGRTFEDFQNMDPSELPHRTDKPSSNSPVLMFRDGTLLNPWMQKTNPSEKREDYKNAIALKNEYQALMSRSDRGRYPKGPMKRIEEIDALYAEGSKLHGVAKGDKPLVFESQDGKQKITRSVQKDSFPKVHDYQSACAEYRREGVIWDRYGAMENGKEIQKNAIDLASGRKVERDALTSDVRSAAAVYANRKTLGMLNAEMNADRKQVGEFLEKVGYEGISKKLPSNEVLKEIMDTQVPTIVDSMEKAAIERSVKANERYAVVVALPGENARRPWEPGVHTTVPKPELSADGTWTLPGVSTSEPAPEPAKESEAEKAAALLGRIQASTPVAVVDEPSVEEQAALA